MTSADLLVDGFSRVRGAVHDAAAGLTGAQLAFQVDPEANSIAWLLWHLTRVQDDHIADLTETEQIWTVQRWNERFGLPLPVDDTGFGHDPEDVAAVQVSGPDLLVGYHDAVFNHTHGFVSGISDEDLPRVIDAAWDPPTTLGVRLISVLSDGLQHAGQAAFTRGVLERAEEQ